MKLNIEHSIFFNIWLFLTQNLAYFWQILMNSDQRKGKRKILIGISRQTSENDNICRDSAKDPRNNSENCRNCRNFRNYSIFWLNNSFADANWGPEAAAGAPRGRRGAPREADRSAPRFGPVPKPLETRKEFDSKLRSSIESQSSSMHWSLKTR